MARYNYRALNTVGRSTRGVLEAAGEMDLYEQLQRGGMELVSCKEIVEGKGASTLVSPFGKPKARDLIQIFVHLEQMQSAGIPLLDALADTRASCDNPKLRDAMTAIYQAVSDGSALSEAMSQHQAIFPPLYLSLIRAGENTGDLAFAYRELIRYLKWIDHMQVMVRKATLYPMILTVVVIGVVVLMMGFVVPKIVSFVREDMSVDLPFITVALINTSDFFVAYWYLILLGPVAAFFLFRFALRASEEFALFVDRQFLTLPVAGILIRKISIARYAQTFGAMFASGINVLKSLHAARQTVTNLALLEALAVVEDRVREGAPLSAALNDSGEFPSLVVHMIRVGEETGNLKKVMDQVSEFYSNDVNEAIEAMMTMIEPVLIAVMGGMMFWIAAGSLAPIYGNLGQLIEGAT